MTVEGLDGAGRRRAVLAHGRLHRRFRRRPGRFLAGYELGELLVLQGHRRGRRELELPGPHRRRLLHPHALREARGGRRRAVLPGADGAPARARHHLPAAGEEPQRRNARPAVRPAGRDRHLPRRHVDAPAGRRRIAPRSARRSRACTSPAPISPASATTRSRSRAGGRSTNRRRRAPTSVQRRACAPTIEQELVASGEGVAARPAAGRDPCRPVSRQRVLSGQPSCPG